ncbi:MAG: hypothetical protein DRH56_04075, partial [Deltaproteobacteria bacterium]
MIRLSLCMIVRNEEENLGACLESMEGLADEVIVVDTGSRDRTMAVARSFGARLFRFAWRDDFSAARNFSIQQATGNCIFWMDADDRLPAESRRDFLTLKRRLSEEKQLPALFFTIRSPFRGNRGCSTFRQVRLFPGRPGLAFEGRIHEQIIPALDRAGIVIKHVDIPILHTGYADEAERRKKARRNLAILEKDDPTPVNLIYRANMLETLGRGEEAARLLLRALEDDESLQRLDGWYEKAVADLARIWIRQGKTAPCERLLSRGLARVPAAFPLLLLMAEVMIRKGVSDAALPYLELAEKNPPRVGPVASNPEQGMSRLFFLMGECRIDSGDPEAARNAFMESLRWSPGNRDAAEGIRRVAAVHEQEGNFSKAVRALEAVSTESSLKDQIHLMCLSLKDPDLSRFAVQAEKVMGLCGLEPRIEISSAGDLALLLLNIAEAVPPSPERGGIIRMIHDALAGRYGESPPAG